MSLRVGIFGGSFNPPHIGHGEICKWLLDGQGLVDLVYVVSCFIHPFGKDLVSFDDRYKMCLFAFSEFGKKVMVSRIEQEMGGISHTIRTIKRLKEMHPDYRFSLVTGGDVGSQANQWKDFDEIKSLVPVIQVPRGVSSPITDISSTEIRKRISLCKDYSALVMPSVAVYILTKGLYR